MNLYPKWSFPWLPDVPNALLNLDFSEELGGENLYHRECKCSYSNIQKDKSTQLIKKHEMSVYRGKQFIKFE